MAFLEQFSEKERTLLASLPYRTGLWISLSDKTGSGESAYDEVDTLESIIEKKAQGMFESAFIHEVMAETYMHSADWKLWAENMDTVLADCQKAIQIIKDKLTDRDIAAYRQNIMYIAVEVAKAFREYGYDASALTRLWVCIKHGCCKMTGGDPESFLNVSYEEDAALKTLHEALRFDSDFDSDTQKKDS